jgi:septal ring factor EnvC (AmiA/AmiB activator)
VAILLARTLSGFAMEEEAGTAKDLGRVHEQIDATRKTHNALQAVRDALDKELAGIEKRYGALARTISELEAEARGRDKRIAKLKRKRDALQASIREQQRILAGQLRSAHVIGRRDWLKLLMNQEEPSRFARVLAYYGYLSQARSVLIERWRQDVAAAQETEAELSGESIRQTETRKQLARERAALGEAGKARRALLEGWNRELKHKADALDRLEEDEYRLRGLLQSVGKAGDSLRAPGGAPQNLPSLPPAGRGRCPPVGPIVARFGSPRMSGRWDGLLIAGTEGAPVRAAAGGRIVFAEWLRGYGLLMIVDHGDGVMSLYAFNQTLNKGVGDVVVPGDVIAAVGASGGRSKPGLYFGIRENGQAVDPVAWCERRH